MACAPPATASARAAAGSAPDEDPLDEVSCTTGSGKQGGGSTWVPEHKRPEIVQATPWEWLAPVVRAGAAVVVIAVMLVADVRGASGSSSVAVLIYHAIANASPLTLGRDRSTRLIPLLGLVGRLAVAARLALATVLAGFAVLAVGALQWAGRRFAHRR